VLERRTAFTYLLNLFRELSILLQKKKALSRKINSLKETQFCFRKIEAKGLNWALVDFPSGKRGLLQENCIYDKKSSFLQEIQTSFRK